MKLPFQHIGFNGWLKLVLAAIFSLYAAMFGYEYLANGIFHPVGFDLLAFWSAGKAALSNSFSSVYDLETLAQIQYSALRDPGISVTEFLPFPVSLFPFFILPFTLIASLDASPAYWLWTVFNSLALVGYLVFLIRHLKPKTRAFPTLLLILSISSYAVYQNFYWGQVEVGLLIIAGEFLRMILEKKPIAAGLWLGGMLLKPQVLVLVLPWLVLARQWKIIQGFSISALVILLVSILLGSWDGMLQMARLWTQFLPGMYSNGPENMINWRMLGIHLNGITHSSFGWIAAGLGMALTGTLCLRLLPRRHKKPTEEHLVHQLTGVLAASLIFTWHSHIHMAMVMIPFLIFGWLNGNLPQRTVVSWTILPAVLQILVLVLAALMFTKLVPWIQGVGGLILGLSGLIIHLVLIFQVLKHQPVSAQSHLQNQPCLYRS